MPKQERYRPPREDLHLADRSVAGGIISPEIPAEKFREGNTSDVELPVNHID